MTRIATLFAICLFCAGFASADGVESAFLQGRYAKAAELAEAEGGADNLARAARSLLAGTIVRGTLDKAGLEKAEALAGEALALDPDHVEGRLQLAIAMSLLSRGMTTREALDAGIASKGRKLVESVLEDEPDNPYAHGFLAVWNIEVVRRGGSIGASMMGASMQNGFDHYQAAQALRGGDPALHWQFVRALAALDAGKYAEEIEAGLARALAATPRSALEESMQARARSFSVYMTIHGKRDVERMAESLL